MSKEPIRLAVIGAGARGSDAYAPYALEHPHLLQISAVAEPDEYKRARFAARYAVPNEDCFSNWEELLSEHRADAVLIATPDNEHVAPILRAMENKWHILAEKPISTSLNETLELQAAIKNYDCVFMICHVLRHTHFFRLMKDVVSSGALGDIVSIQHAENVGYFHHAHSFVRGNWSREESSSPMILAKCCHDFDILNWLVNSECTRIASFGSLRHFREEHAPANSPSRCSEGCPVEEHCPYSTRHYFDDDGKHAFSAFAQIVKNAGHSEDLETALLRTPYGRCVYRCDNDVVDHQVAIVEYENGCSVSFSMSAFSSRTSRAITLMGTLGELQGNMEENRLTLHDYKSGTSRELPLPAEDGMHGGGDTGLIHDFVQQIMSPDNNKLRSANHQGINAHIMAFAAERARISGNVQTGFLV